MENLPVIDHKAFAALCHLVDATKSQEQRRQLETELEAVGIRLNGKAPDGKSRIGRIVDYCQAYILDYYAVVFKQKLTGGVSRNMSCHCFFLP